MATVPHSGRINVLGMNRNVVISQLKMEVKWINFNLEITSKRLFKVNKQCPFVRPSVTRNDFLNSTASSQFRQTRDFHPSKLNLWNTFWIWIWIWIFRFGMEFEKNENFMSWNPGCKSFYLVLIFTSHNSVSSLFIAVLS